MEEKMRKYLQHRAKAYFTVESAMVLGVVLSVIIVLAYIMLFQYNRCLLEQDTGSLALKGCSLQAENNDGLMAELQRYDAQTHTEKYIAWEWGQVSFELGQNRVRVKQSGNLLFPFAGNDLLNTESEWGTEVVYENKRISPISFIRIYKKLTGGE